MGIVGLYSTGYGEILEVDESLVAQYVALGWLPITGGGGGGGVTDSAVAQQVTSGTQTKGALDAAYAATLLTATTATSAATLVADKHTPVDATSGALTMTLPTPTRIGQQIRVEKVDSSANVVTVSGALRGAAGTVPMPFQYEVRTFIAESLSSWRVASGNTPKTALDAAYRQVAQSTAAFVSNASGTKLAAPVTLPAPSAMTPTGTDVVIEPTTGHQVMLGFGAALTDASAWLLWTQLSAAQRNSLLTELFSPSQGNMSVVRVSIGPSDFARQTWETLDGGPSDTAMNNFSIGTGTPGTTSATRDLRYLIPILQQIMKINPTVKVIGAVWSPPAWMKTSGVLTGGTFGGGTTISPAYAKYLVKWIQAYQSYGIPIHAISPQNEPNTQVAYPSCYWDSSQLVDFINTYLGPAMDAANLLDVGILAWDGNWNDLTTPTNICSGASGPWISAIAWHGYGGTPAAQTTLMRGAGAGKLSYFTELRTFQSDSLTFAQSLMAGTIGCTSIKRGNSLICLWNLALDEQGKPFQTSGGRRGVITVSTSTPGSVTRNPESMMLRQLGQHLRPGAVRVNATSTLPAVAFRNLDGSLLTYLYNSGASAVTTNIINGATGLGVPLTLQAGESASVITGATGSLNTSVPQANGLLSGGVSAAPGAPVLTFVSATNTSITLDLQTGAANGSAVSMSVRVATTSAGLASATPATIDQTVAAVSITGLTGGTTYYAQVTATNSSGATTSNIVSGATTGSSDTTPPSAPTNLAAGSPTSSTVPLSWTASTDDVGVAKYRVYRGATLVGEPTSTSFTDTGLTAQVAYTYAVSAVDAAGNESAKSSTVTATTAASGGGGGGTPSVGTATSASNSSLSINSTLTWSQTIASGDKVLVVATNASVNSGPTIVSVSCGSTAMAKTAQAESGTGTSDREASLWTLVNPPVGTQTITVTTRGGASTNFSVGGTSFVVNGSAGAIGATATSKASPGTSLSATTASDANSVVIGSMAARSTSAVATGTGQTSLRNGIVGSNMAEAVTWQVGASSVTTTASWTTSDAGAIATVSIS